jgi:protein involved in polysaccharide export with SLBB domain
MKVLEEVDFGQLLLGQNLEHNIALRPRDFIFLPSSLSTEKEIFVLGQVVEPGRYRFLRTTTFLGAVAQAEGTLRSGAWERRCLVIRGGLKGDQEIIPVNLPAIVAGEEEDFPLENGDIVYVPKTPLFKTAEIIESVLLPLRKILEVDDMGKNQFREGHRQWEDIISSRALGGG